MKKLIPLVLAFVLLFSSCFSFLDENVPDTPDENLPAPQTKDELYSLYSKVSRGQTKAELDELFGEPTPSYNEYGELKFYTYFNETKSAGVSVIFDEDEVVDAKNLFFNTKYNLVPFSGRYINENIHLIKTDTAVSKAIEIMEGSEPLELSCRYGDDGPDDTLNIYAWYNEDGASFMLHTNKGLVENVALYRD